MKSTRKLDLFAGLFFICIAAIIIWVAIPYGIQEPKKVKFAALSPSYYPRLVGISLLLFGTILLATRWLSNADSEQGAQENLRDNWLVVLIGLVATLVAYYIALEPLGFVLASAIAVFVLLLIAGERSIVALFAISLLLPITLHLFFTHIANIPIPSGVLRPIIGGA
ncbi:MAG: tripartite tricarboxylate transporter TctB family protein [Gammaproteobacteria bacterium]|nr:tripartite tricarboxylate transporter TctB family protein [Gammaproteobacteria bacterium]